MRERCEAVHVCVVLVGSSTAMDDIIGVGGLECGHGWHEEAVKDDYKGTVVSVLCSISQMLASGTVS